MIINNTKRLGELSEAKLLVKFLSLDYICSLPHGDSARYDLIIDDGEKLQKVQIKTGCVRKGCVLFRASNHNRIGKGGYRKRDYINDIDLFAVYVPELDKFYLIPVEEAGTTIKSLRLISSSRRSKISYAVDYEI